MALLKNPIILALDVDDKFEAKKILTEVGDLVGAVKLGPRLLYKYGAEIVREISQDTAVFVDNKYFDIPSTMVSAVKASFEAGATLVTVHALSGKGALAELAKLELELDKIRPFKILAVTILTSWDEASYPASLQPWAVEQHVQHLAQEAYESGLRGLVCSGHELELLKYSNVFKVVPGIRLANSSVGMGTHHDQKRVMTPRQAIELGASALVVGRAILESGSRRKTVSEILQNCT